MIDEEESDMDKPLFAAIKLYADTKVKIVPVQDIKHFVLQEKFTKPYFIKTMNPVTDLEEYEPGQILAVSHDVKELQENRTRYKFAKVRRSDALQQLAAESDQNSEEENESERKSTKDIEQKKKGYSDKLKAEKRVESKILKSTIKKDQQRINEEIMKEKMKSLGNDDFNLNEESLQITDKFTATSLKLEIDHQQKNISPDGQYKEIKIPLKPDVSALKSIKDVQEGTVMVNQVDDLEFHENFKERESTFIELEREIQNLKSIIEEKDNIITKKKKKIYKKNEKIIELTNELNAIKETLTKLQSHEKSSSLLTEKFEKIEKIDPLSTAVKNNDRELFQDVRQPVTTPEKTDDRKLTPSKALSRASTPISPLSQLTNSPTSNNPGNERCKKRLHQNISQEDEIQLENDINQSNIILKKIKTEIKQKKRNNCDYDSDDYSKSDIEEEKINNFTSWKKTVENKTIKMFHLCYGISIYHSEWKALNTKEESKFVRSLAEAIWSSHDLKNRAIDVTKVNSKLPDRSPVRPCTPKKMAALRKTYWHYLTLKKKISPEILKNMPIKEKEQILNKWRVHLKAKINSLRGGKCEKKDQD